MSGQVGALVVERCARCGRDQTVLRTPTGELVPVCICCGGGDLARDRYCRHHEPQAQLPLRGPS